MLYIKDIRCIINRAELYKCIEYMSLGSGIVMWTDVWIWNNALFGYTKPHGCILSVDQWLMAIHLRPGAKWSVRTVTGREQVLFVGLVVYSWPGAKHICYDPSIVTLARWDGCIRGHSKTEGHTSRVVRNRIWDTPRLQ